MHQRFTIATEFEAETGRWIAEVMEVAAVQYGATREEAIRQALVLALQVLADRIAHNEATEAELALVYAA